MKYLSFDIEATGLEENAFIIEYAMIPFCSKTRTFNHSLEKHFYIKCPSFEQLKPKLNEWVIQNNENLIRKAHQDGIELKDFKEQMQNYLESTPVKQYFNNKKITLFGKSMSSIDLPFLNRDLGWEWMNKYFHHRNLDLSCFTKGLIDMGLLEEGMDSGEKMMKYFNMGEVSHTALEDAINTAKMYFKILNQFETDRLN
ncbi:MAG: 3'-5' exoribonuclease [Bacteriovoracaceae bacterium]|jgi:DNA polymerase-3 subunit epsilon|nr:3'-5' exoribonuclease [Bacteriovoracaceae bacterium]